MKPPAPLFLAARRGGFTLVELLVVVMLLGVMAGVAAPQFVDVVAGIEVEAGAKLVAADLRHARREAMRRGVTLGITFDIAGDRYESQATLARPATVSDPDRDGAPLQRNLDERMGLSITSADFSGAPELTFDFRGDPSSIGSMTVANEAGAYTVRVDELGGVTVQ